MIASWSNLTAEQRWRVRMAIATAWSEGDREPLSAEEFETLAECLFMKRLETQSALIADDLADPAIAQLELTHLKREIAATRDAKTHDTKTHDTKTQPPPTIYPTHMG
ncbi:MAG: hypothetical protein AAF889_11190 [Cyanobacteria bacterium P01_D01_bin.73]